MFNEINNYLIITKIENIFYYSKKNHLEENIKNIKTYNNNKLIKSR